MIFSPSLVLLSYCVGIISFTSIIRSYKLIGAGFFWLMNSIAFGLSALAFVADTNLLVALISLITFGVLLLSILNRSKVKDESDHVTIVLSLITIAPYLVYSFNTAQDTKVDLIWLEVLRSISGAALLGGVTTAMLLGHWYLVQPGLSRKPIADMCMAVLVALTVNTLLWFTKPSMFSVFTGSISDGWGGTLGYMWAGSVVTTFVLMVAASKALKEKSYSAVMATTGLLYLAILVANGVELIPRAIFS